jgi:putative SOS response-associated peptidase YedK
VLHELVPIFEHAELFPRYNIAPTQEVLAVRQPDASGPEAAWLRWGLVPSWSHAPHGGMINARAETLARQPSFRAAFRKRRCLVLADGFYEWKATNGGKQPYYLRLADGSPFAFAGISERAEVDGKHLESCAIVTTDANELVRPLHDRMPVILAREDFSLWLDPNRHGDAELQALLRPFPSSAMTAYPVSTRVNSPRHDAPDCIEPAEPAPKHEQRSLFDEA